MLNHDKIGQNYKITSAHWNKQNPKRIHLFLSVLALYKEAAWGDTWIPTYQALGIQSHAAEGRRLFRVQAWKASDKRLGYPVAISLDAR